MSSSLDEVENGEAATVSLGDSDLVQTSPELNGNSLSNDFSVESSIAEDNFLRETVNRSQDLDNVGEAGEQHSPDEFVSGNTEAKYSCLAEDGSGETGVSFVEETLLKYTQRTAQQASDVSSDTEATGETTSVEDTQLKHTHNVAQQVCDVSSDVKATGVLTFVEDTQLKHAQSTAQQASNANSLIETSGTANDTELKQRNAVTQGDEDGGLLSTNMSLGYVASDNTCVIIHEQTAVGGLRDDGDHEPCDTDQDGETMTEQCKEELRKMAMKDIHKGALERATSDLISQLSSVYEIIQYLNQEFILSDSEREDLEHMLNPQSDQSRKQTIDQLLKHLPYKSEYAFTAFRHSILIRAQQIHLVEVLDTACREIESQSDCKDAFESFRVKDIPSYYIDRHINVSEVMQMLDQDRMVGIVGNQPYCTTSPCDSASGKRHRKRADIVGIRGFGGIGKTILALKVCEQMKSKLPIIWLSLGQRPNILQLFSQIHEDLIGEPRTFANQENAIDWLQKDSERLHSFLLILDDVWSLDDASPFKCIARKCKILITTRTKSILERLDASVHEVKPLDETESRNLLLKSSKLRPEISDKELNNVITNILKLLGGLPLAIVLIGCSLKREQYLLSDWQLTYDRMLYVKDKFLQGPSQIPSDLYEHCNIYEAFEVSFLALNAESERSWNLIQKRCLDFAIFPEDIEIPSNVVMKLWQQRLPRKTRRDTTLMWDHLDELVDRSFLTFIGEKDGVRYYIIHDLLLEYAKYKLSQEQSRLVRVHEELLAAYSKGLADNLGVTQWWEVEDDGYFYHNLAHHLFEGDRVQEFKCLLWNIKWLERKVFVLNIPALLAEFKFLKHIEDVTEGEICETGDDKLLQKSLVLSSHILASYKEQICPQLVGRLVGYNSVNIQQLVSDIKEYAKIKSQMLIPDAPCLSPPDGYRIRSFRHSSTVICAALSSNKRYLYTGCASNHLRRFDLHTDQVEFLGSENQRHNGMVFSMVLEEDAGYIVTGSFDNNIHLWPIMKNSLISFKRFRGHTDAVISVATIPEKDLIISGSADKSIRVWGIKYGTSKIIHNVDQYCVREVTAVRHDTRTILSVGEEPGLIKMWDYGTTEVVNSWMGHEGSVYTVRATPDGARVVSGGKDDCLVKVWDMSGCLLVTCAGHILGVLRCFVTADSNYVLSGSLDKTARFWYIGESGNGKLERTFYCHGRAAPVLYVSNDNKITITGGEDQLAILWNSDLSDSIENPQLKRHDLEVTSLASSPDGSLIVSSSRDKTVKVWKWPGMELLGTLNGHSDSVNCSIISYRPCNTDQLVAISGGNDQSICVWNLSPVETTPLHVFNKCHKYAVTSLCAFDKGKYLASGSLDSVILVHDLQSHSLLLEIDCQQYSNVRQIIVEDSKLLAAFGDLTLSFDIPDFQEPLNSTIALTSPSVCRATDRHCFSSTPRSLGSGFIASFWDYNKVRVISIVPLLEVRLISPHKSHRDLVTAVFAGNNDSFIWTGSRYGNIGLINRAVKPAVCAELSCPLREPFPVTAVVVSASHTTCVAGFANGEVWAWTSSAGVFSKPRVRRLAIFSEAVESIDMWDSGDTCMVAASSSNCLNPIAEIWDVVDCKKLHSLKRHSGKVTRVLFIANGSRLLTASLDGCVCLWNTKTGELKRQDKSNLKYGILSLAVDTKETFYVVGGFENVIEVHSTSTGELESVLSTNEFHHIQNMYIRETNTIVCAFACEYFVEIEIDSGKMLFTAYGMQKEFGPVCHVVNSNQVISAATHCQAKVWDVVTGRTVCSFQAGLNRALLSACTMKCGYVVTGSYDRVVKVWNVSNAEDPSLVTSFTFEHAVTAVHEFSSDSLAVGLLNGQVCFLHVTS